MGFMQWRAWRVWAVCAALVLSACGAGDAPDGGQAAQAKADAVFTGNGTWWNPQEPGTGFFFEAQGGVGVITFYAFETSGKPVWYSGVGSLAATATGHEFKGTLQRYTGGQAASSKVPRTPVAAAAGAVRVLFKGDGAQVFVPDRVYDARKFNATGQGRQANGSQPETGIYWNPAESGRGYTIEINSDIATVGVFHYDADGQPTWHLVVGSMVRNGMEAVFNAYRDGQTLPGQYRPAQGPFDEGRMRVAFVEACAGKVWLPGMGTTPVQRFSFGSLPPGEECAASRGVAVRSPQDGPAYGVARNLQTGWVAQAALAIDAAGVIFAAEGNLVRKIMPDGSSQVLAGSEAAGYVDGTATLARFSSIKGLALDAAGNVYVADSTNTAIRKITPAGVVSTHAGRTGAGFRPVDGDRQAARFGVLGTLRSDKAGNLYVADSESVRKIAPDGSVSTLIGLFTSELRTVADGTSARFYTINSLDVDREGRIYVAETDFKGSGWLRRFDKDGRMLPYPGTADGTVPTGQPTDMVVDAAGNAYIGNSGADISGTGAATDYMMRTGIFKVTGQGLFSMYVGEIKPGNSYPATIDELFRGVVKNPRVLVLDARDPAVPRLMVRDAAGWIEVMPGPR